MINIKNSQEQGWAKVLFIGFIAIFLSNVMYCQDLDSLQLDSLALSLTRPIAKDTLKVKAATTYTTNIIPRKESAIEMGVDSSDVSLSLDSLTLDSLNLAGLSLDSLNLDSMGMALDNIALLMDSLNLDSTSVIEETTAVIDTNLVKANRAEELEMLMQKKCAALNSRSGDKVFAYFIESHTNTFYFKNGQFQNEACFIHLAKSINKGQLIIAITDENKFTANFKRLKLEQLLLEIGLDYDQFEVHHINKYEEGWEWLGESRDLKMTWVY